MTLPAPTTLSLAAAMVYICVSLACFAASLTAIRNGQQGSHRNAWVLIALLFVAFAIMRAFALEEWIRDEMREYLRSARDYRDRRDWQRPLAAGIIFVVSALAAVWFFRLRRVARDRLNLIVEVAYGGTLALGLLVVVRLISLHQVDKLLNGPLKLNWLFDLGAAVAVLGAAIAYAVLVRSRPGTARGSRRR